MKIRLSFLALGLLILFGSLLASSQRISAYQAADRPSASPAAGLSVLGAGTPPLGGASLAFTGLITYTTNLPMVVKNYVRGIYGYVTQGGAPIGGISLELYNNSSNSSVAMAMTNAAGYYLFTGIPALGTGQFYFVEYLNREQINSRLYRWDSANVTSYTTNSSVSLGTSDLADIRLVDPEPGATVALPRLFQWTARAATPSDKYFLELFSSPDSPDTFWGPLLGYVSSYTLTSLPAGFSPNVQYGWAIDLKDANGGIGFSYYYNPIKFSNAGATIAAPLNVSPQTTGRRDDLPPHRHPAE